MILLLKNYVWVLLVGKPQIFVKIFDDDVILSLELGHEANFFCSLDGLVISLGGYFAFATFRQLNSISQSYKLGHLCPQGTIWASESFVVGQTSKWF